MISPCAQRLYSYRYWWQNYCEQIIAQNGSGNLYSLKKKEWQAIKRKTIDLYIIQIKIEKVTDEKWDHIKNVKKKTRLEREYP